jgi:hypothetical protein
MSCLQWCRYCNDLALPVLYRDVVLYNTTIRLLTAALTHHKLAFIRSMTLHIDLVLGLTGTGPVSSVLHHEKRHPRAGKLGTFKVCKLWLDIQDLVPYIRDMISLTTFSLRTTCSGEYVMPQDQDLPVRRMDINGLLQAIPTSCRSAELNTQGAIAIYLHLVVISVKSSRSFSPIASPAPACTTYMSCDVWEEGIKAKQPTYLNLISPDNHQISKPCSLPQ